MTKQKRAIWIVVAALIGVGAAVGWWLPLQRGNAPTVVSSQAVVNRFVSVEVQGPITATGPITNLGSTDLRGNVYNSTGPLTLADEIEVQGTSVLSGPVTLSSTLKVYNTITLQNGETIVNVPDGYIGINGTSGISLSVAGGGLRVIGNATSPMIAGGYSGNTASGTGSFVGGGGGSGAVNTASGEYSTVSGGIGNIASLEYSTVGGGYDNAASHEYSTVGGGYDNDADGWAATVGGGRGNAAANSSTISGGESNSTIGGGDFSVIGGGYANTASGYDATIGGGWTNIASGYYSAISGGIGNTTSGYAATVSGGESNIASGDYSFAAGRRAVAGAPGAFVWADSTDADYTSSIPDSFNVRATGGVTLTTYSAGLYLDGPIIVNGLTFTVTAPITVAGVLTNVQLLFYQVP